MSVFKATKSCCRFHDKTTPAETNMFVFKEAAINESPIRCSHESFFIEFTPQHTFFLFSRFVFSSSRRFLSSSSLASFFFSSVLAASLKSLSWFGFIRFNRRMAWSLASSGVGDGERQREDPDDGRGEDGDDDAADRREGVGGAAADREGGGDRAESLISSDRKESVGGVCLTEDWVLFRSVWPRQSSCRELSLSLNTSPGVNWKSKREIQTEARRFLNANGRKAGAKVGDLRYARAHARSPMFFVQRQHVADNKNRRIKETHGALTALSLLPADCIKVVGASGNSASCTVVCAIFCARTFASDLASSKD